MGRVWKKRSWGEDTSAPEHSVSKDPEVEKYGSLGFAKISCPVGSYDNYVNRGSPHTPTREKKIPDL